MRVGQLIRSERLKRGMTLACVASATGVSTSHVSDVENGRRSVPPRTALKFANALGVAPELLVQAVLAEKLAPLGLRCTVYREVELSAEQEAREMDVRATWGDE